MLRGKNAIIKENRGPCSFEMTKDYFWGCNEETGAFFKFSVTKDSVSLTVGNVNLAVSDKEEISATFKNDTDYKVKCSEIIAKIGNSLSRLIQEGKYEPYLVDLSYEFGNSKLVFGSKYANELYKQFADMITTKFSHYMACKAIIDCYQAQLREVDEKIIAFNKKSNLYQKLHKRELAGYAGTKMRIVGQIKAEQNSIGPFKEFKKEYKEHSLRQYLSDKTKDRLELDALSQAIPIASSVIIGPFGVVEDGTVDQISDEIVKSNLKGARFDSLVKMALRYKELKQKTA